MTISVLNDDADENLFTMFIIQCYLLNVFFLKKLNYWENSV